MLDAPARLAAVDYGTKRVGLALADPTRTFAQPHGAFSQAEAVAELKRLRDHAGGLDLVVVGWPLTEAGAEGAATERVQQYVNRLRNALPGVELTTWDERYTSEEAKAHIREAGGRHTRENRGRVDAAAAALILQRYLDRDG